MREETETMAAERYAEDATAAAEAADLEAIAPQHFAVRDEDSADWLVRKLVEAEAHIVRVKQQSQREIRRTQREHAFLLARYGPQLEAWAKAELTKHKGRRKSLNLLSGTVGFRRVASRLVVDDAARALSWAKKHCKPAVIVTERLSKSQLNDRFVQTGEVAPGVHIEPAKESFYVK